VNQRLELRASHLPSDGIRILLIGESPLGNGGSFYEGNSSLYGFSVPVVTDKCAWPLERVEFLKRFSEEGFYLDDISQTAGRKVSDLSKTEQDSGVSRVSKVISQHRPSAVIGVLKSIEGLVRRCIESSEVPDTTWRCITFPNRRFPKRQEAFQVELSHALRDFGCSRP
jgi:hypothetical protein